MPDAKAELYGLWSSLFGEPPSIEASPTLIAGVLVRALPAAPPYAIGAAVREARMRHPGRPAPVYPSADER